MIIAVTGTVGSGKSGVAAMFAALKGCELIDTDEICRELLVCGRPAWIRLKERWPNFFTSEGELDRRMLREAVFSVPDIRQGLEEILHPLVREEVVARVRRVRAGGGDLLVEVPLLFEVGWQDEVDTVVSVYAPEELSLTRVACRDGVTSENVQAILALQLTALEKARRADWVIDNSGTWAATFLQANLLAKHLQ